MDLLTPRALASPHRLALIWGQHTLTYRRLAEHTAALAQRLRREGITKGTRVAALLSKSPEAVALIHALAQLDAVIVPLNLRLTPGEMAAQIERSRATHVVATEAAAAQARMVAQARPLLEITPAIWQHTLPLAPTAPQPAQFVAQTPLAILFTSGTTGQSKAAVLTAANFYWSAVGSAYRLGVFPEDRWLLTLPLYHVGGLSILFRSALYGTTVVLPDAAATTSFDPAGLYEALVAHKVTLVSLVPTMLHRLLAAVDAPPPPHLRTVLLGGAATPNDLLHTAQARDYPVALTYGLTEATSQVATATPAEVRRKPGSVGHPLLLTEVQVVDEHGHPMPPGAIGEIVVRGPTVFAGYDQDPKATQAALRSGWLHTGDLGYLDADGALWMVNRRNDLIVTGGENVYPAEVETVLRQHPAVADVCVVGLDDAEWGQRVAAAVVLHPNQRTTPAALETHCREHLAGYKIPRLIRIVPDLPRTASGKVKRGAVRNLLMRGEG